jgi:uncharacterized protein (DUF3820 family)
MNKLFCKHCSQAVTFITQLKSNNYVAYCTICGCFIKNVPHSDLGIVNVDHSFPFGKYKGMKIYDCSDESYLTWALANLKMNEGFMECIFNRIEQLRSK